MIYTRLAVTPSDPARREAVSAALFAAGAEGILEEGASLVTVFESDSVAAAAERAARTADDAAHLSRDAFDPGDWTEAWRNGVRAHEVGELTVAPPWLGPPTASRIVIDPGLGFGTGEHETTRIALQMMQGVVRRGDVVADVGCGSGVLAIAAARLGAVRVAAIDNDAQAIRNAEENIVTNDVSSIVTLIEGDAAVLLPFLAPIRVIVANIVSSVLTEMLPVFDRALAAGGDVIVGGVLRAEHVAFTQAANDAGWTLVAERHDGDWWGGHLQRSRS